MPEIPICVALVQSNHDYGLVESFPNMNSSQQTLDLTHLSILFRSVAEATHANRCGSSKSGRGFKNFARAQSARSFNRTPLREILDPPLREVLNFILGYLIDYLRDYSYIIHHYLITTEK